MSESRTEQTEPEWLTRLRDSMLSEISAVRFGDSTFAGTEMAVELAGLATGLAASYLHPLHSERNANRSLLHAIAKSVRGERYNSILYLDDLPAEVAELAVRASAAAVTAPRVCGALEPTKSTTAPCTLTADHDGQHRAIMTGGSSVVWADPVPAPEVEVEDWDVKPGDLYHVTLLIADVDEGAIIDIPKAWQYFREGTYEAPLRLATRITRPPIPQAPGSRGDAKVRGKVRAMVVRSTSGERPWLSSIAVDGQSWHADSDLSDYLPEGETK